MTTHTPDQSTRIAFIGTGIMGSEMAAHLLASGYPLVVHNRTRSKPDALVAQGAVWAESPAAAAKDADTVITMLAHPQAVEAVALDEETGLLGAMKPGAVWLDCSTTNPAFARRMAEQAQRKGIHHLDAPVSGSQKQAQAAELLFFVGGEEAVLEGCRGMLDVMGKQVNYVGGHGMGIAFKLVINHLLATSMAAFAEALTLGEALGISQEALLNTLIGSVVTAPYIARKREKLATGDYQAEFPLRWMQKDLEMVAGAAYEVGTAMPVSNAAKETFRLAIQYGYGDDDLSAIYAFLKGRPGAS
jgi:3-hydroxyisobutyrate dehydrogenase-like beta-hydroxyacid dehydrogenase